MSNRINNLKNIKENIHKVDNYLVNNFGIIYDFQFNNDIFLLSGAIRDSIVDMAPRDLDIVMLSEDDSELQEFINKHSLKYKRNSFGGYKIEFNNITVDFWATNDLLKTIEYNLDGLFYDIKDRKILPIGYLSAVENKTLNRLNDDSKHPSNERQLERELKLKEFIKNI